MHIVVQSEYDIETEVTTHTGIAVFATRKQAEYFISLHEQTWWDPDQVDPPCPCPACQKSDTQDLEDLPGLRVKLWIRTKRCQHCGQLPNLETKLCACTPCPCCGLMNPSDVEVCPHGRFGFWKVLHEAKIAEIEAG